MSDTKLCPYCKGEIKAGAIKCKHCKSMLDQEEQIEQKQNAKLVADEKILLIDGAEYVGQLKDGLPDGQGTLSLVGGSKFVGEFKDGEWHGQGAYFGNDGTVIKGKFSHGESKGDVDVEFADGTKFFGEVKGVVPHGQGTATWPDGSKYIGQWENSKPHGRGIVTLLDGQKYDGEWKDGSPNGQGTMSYADGRIENGKWEQGKFLGDTKKRTTTGKAKPISKEEVDKKKPPVTAGKKNKGGAALINSPSNWFAAEDENYHYICNTEQSHSIYKISKDEAEPVRLNEDETWYLNLSGDWLYYSNKSDQGHIYKIKKNGTERTKICEESAVYLNVDNDWLYYCNGSDNNRIYKVKSDGSNRECLSDNSAAYLCLQEGWLVYANLSDDSKIYKLKVDGSENVKLGDDKAKFLSIMGEWVYYSNEDKYGSLHRLGLDGHEKVVLNDERSEYVIAKEDFIYYTCAYRDCSLFRIRSDGKGRKKVIDAEAHLINCLSDAIYYLNFSQGGKLYISNITGTINEALGIEESRGIASDVAQPGMGNSPGNIVNHGIAAIDGDWLYYHHEDALYKEHCNGSGQIKLVEKNTSFINVLNDWVYYVNADNHNIYGLSEGLTQYIYKTRTDGSGHTIVSTDRSAYLNVVGEWIYYVNESDEAKIYRIRTDGSEKASISNVRTNCLNCSGQWFVFINLDDASPKEEKQFSISESNFGKIYKMKHDGSNLSPLGSDETEHICVADDWVYYLNRNENNCIYRVNVYTSAVEKVTDIEANNLNYDDGWLYFDSDGLKRIRPNGTGLKMVCNSDARSINVAGEWIYFIETIDVWENFVSRVRKDGSGYALLVERGNSAKQLRVRFDDGKSYIYRTLDRNIKLGSKVMVEGKKAGLTGEVIEENAKYNKNADAQYISEVISYGTGKIDGLSDQAKESIKNITPRKATSNFIVEVKRTKDVKGKAYFCKTKDLDIDVGTIVAYKTNNQYGKHKEEIGVVTKRRVKGVSASNAYEVIRRYPDGSKLEQIKEEVKKKEAEAKKREAEAMKNFKSDLVAVRFEDRRTYSYKNTDPNLSMGSVVQVTRGGNVWEGKVVGFNVVPKEHIPYLSIEKVLSYGEKDS